MEKKEQILNYIIKAYIELLEPIGSNTLKKMYNISYSSSSMRNYFNKLDKEGFLIQKHISGGRIPTNNTLKNFWENNIKFNINEINEKKMKKLAKKIGITIFIKEQTDDILFRVLNVENKYIILEYYKTNELPTNNVLTTSNNSYSITIKYNEIFFNFLNTMIGRSFDNILDVSIQVGATKLYVELIDFVRKNKLEVINPKIFLKSAIENKMSDEVINLFIQGDFINNIKEGIYFDDILKENQIAICHKTTVNNKKIKMLVIGDINKNYTKLYKGIKNDRI